MTEFVGRAGNLALFGDGSSAVVVNEDLNLIVEFGTEEVLVSKRSWSGQAEPAATSAELASAALSSLNIVEETAGRLYSVPKSVLNTAASALSAIEEAPVARAYTTPVGLHTGAVLASGRQLSLSEVHHINKYFLRNETHKFASTTNIPEYLYGGEAGRAWVESIISKANEKSLTADGYPLSTYNEDVIVYEPLPEYGADVDAFKEALETEESYGPEFLARVRHDGSGIDRLYRVDPNGSVFLWDDGHWDDMGKVGADIWAFDKALDKDDDDCEKTHILIDPESAIVVSARLQSDPFTPVAVEDIDPAEAQHFMDSIGEIDLEVIDRVLTAAGAVGDSIYTEEERSENATKQLRDGGGKFAKQGGRVTVDARPGAAGTIQKLNRTSGTVEVAMDNGEVLTVPVQQTRATSSTVLPQSQAPATPGTAPGSGNTTIPKLDLSGILAEPRTPTNRTIAQLPGTLPVLSNDALHSILNNFPAWVASQRNDFKQLQIPGSTYVQPKDEGNLDHHPLLDDWLKKKNKKPTESALWYQPVTAAGAPAKAMSPKQSDVTPLYLAVVSPEDPRAVFDCIALVPSSDQSTSPMTYARRKGKWERDPLILNDLNSATPPPVVPLDASVLEDVLAQVDQNSPETASDEAGLSASGVIPREHPLIVLWGTPSAIVAAGGVDRNRGNAEELRRYWTKGPGAAKIGWGTPGDWRRCVRYLSKHMVDAEGYCQLRHKETVGKYTGDQKNHASVEEFEIDSAFEIPQNIIDAAREYDSLTAAGGVDRNRGDAEKLRRYWTVGAGAMKIRWGMPGDWTRCVRHLGKYLGPRARGYCALRHKEMTGMWTGDKRHLQLDARKTSGKRAFSIDSVKTTEAVLADAMVRISAEDARGRMYGQKNTIQGGRFRIPIVLPEGIPSGDGRTIVPGATTMRKLPLSLMWQIKTGDGHNASVVVGRIDEMHRIDDGIGEAYGYFDTGKYGAEAERMVRGGFLRFVSADMDQFEAQEETDPEKEAADKDPKAPRSIKNSDLTINKARIMGVTIVAKPAFQECTIEMVDPEDLFEEDIVIPDGIYMDELDPLDAAALVACGQVASVIPLTPPRVWFNNPQLTGPTPLTVDDDGRVFGHIATWDTDHIGYNNGTKAPKSRSRYAYFHTGVVRADDGEDVPVGQLTLAGGHAGMEASAAEAARHYDDTGSAIADIHAGEDRYGIWVAGALRTNASPEQIRALRASAPSGDWRPIRGSLELVAICQVNVPGFPTARARVASGQVMALVAAGAATLAKMKNDPLRDVSNRLAAIEMKELQAKRAAVSAKMAPVIASGAQADAEKLAAKRKAAADRMQAIMASGKPEEAAPFDLSARLASARARFAEFANGSEKDERRPEPGVDENKLVRKETEVPAAPQPAAEESEGKYTPKTQPRDARGRFRDVLARLRDNLGVDGNQEVMDRLKQAEDYTHVGNYKAANKAAGDLVSVIDALDDGELNADSIGNVRKATGELGKVLANLPLPTTNQAQKVRYSDLPPTLRELVDDFIERVEAKIGKEDAESAVAPLKAFRSGSDTLSQSEISKHMNVLLRLLT